MNIKSPLKRYSVFGLSNHWRQCIPQFTGLDLEPQAAFIYAWIAKQNQVNLFPSGLVINPKCPWLGCTPDRKVFDLNVEEQGPFGDKGWCY